MSWSSNHLPKYRKHRASGQAIVTICGRDYYLGPHGTKASKVEYDRLITEYLANGRQPLHTSPTEITVVELCARYIDFAKGYYRKKDGTLTTTSGSDYLFVDAWGKVHLGSQPLQRLWPFFKALC